MKTLEIVLQHSCSLLLWMLGDAREGGLLRIETKPANAPQLDHIASTIIYRPIAGCQERPRFYQQYRCTFSIVLLSYPLYHCNPSSSRTLLALKQGL